VMAEQELRVQTGLKISRSTATVYEAIVNPAEMSGYFISSGSGRLDGGETVVWNWDDVGAELAVTPQEIEENHRVGFNWRASGVETRVVIEINGETDKTTAIQVTESGWPRDAEGTERCLQQMQGWVHMLCCLKAYLEHGINLRE
ncbi:MAG: SRPBCC domain-containing protein, partial [Pirellulaceae bacterium]